MTICANLRFWLDDLHFLASEDALEVMYVSEWVSQSVNEGTDTDFTDVTLVSDDTYWRLYWCYPGK